MPNDAISLQQGDAGSAAYSAIVTELLQILAEAGLASEPAEAPNGLRTPEPQEEASGYGKGIAARGYADYTKAAIPPTLKAAVEGDPPRMIAADVWQELSKQNEKAAADAAASLRGQQADFKAREAELDRLKIITNKIADDWDKKEGVDLTEFGEGKIPPEDISQRAQEFNKKRSEAERSLTAAKIKLQVSPERASDALRLMDHPRNNPERAQITSGLKQFEATAAKGGTPKQAAAATFKNLQALQASLFAWNDRRARENQPPAAEAIALGDLLQRIQREVIQGIAARKEDLPLPDGLPANEAQESQQAWQNLVASGDPNWTPGPGNRIGVPVEPDQPILSKFGMPTPDKLDKAQAENFRAATLTNFASLMQTSAGRSLVGQINAGSHKVVIRPGVEPGQLDASPGSDSRKQKGRGDDSTVSMVAGSKDSDMMLATKDGNVLTAPGPIVLGHELVHALHSSKGVSGKDIGTGKIPEAEMDLWAEGGLEDPTLWTNMEEYKTIAKGKLSEQTLRAQFGLSATRFGHGSPAVGARVKNSFETAIDNYNEMEKSDPAQVDKLLIGRKFDPNSLTDRQKLELLKSDATGPLPAGWPVAQLSTAQIKAVVAEKLDYKQFRALGWSPFDLDDKDIVTFVKKTAYNDRTPNGLAYRKAGGDNVFAALSSFAKQTHARVPKAPGGELSEPLAGVATAAKLKAINEVETVLDAFLRSASDELDPKTLDVDKSSKLSRRLATAALACTMAEQSLVRTFKQIASDNEKVNNDKSYSVMIKAMTDVETTLAVQGGNAEALLIDEKLNTARKAVFNCENVKPTLIANKAAKRRQETCNAITAQLAILEKRRDSVRKRTESDLNKILAATGYTEGDVETLGRLMTTKLLEPRLAQRIGNAWRDAKAAVAKKT
jgi:hypothetical protein